MSEQPPVSNGDIVREAAPQRQSAVTAMPAPNRPAMPPRGGPGGGGGGRGRGGPGGGGGRGGPGGGNRGGPGGGGGNRGGPGGGGGDRRGRGGPGGGRGRRGDQQQEQEASEFVEKVVFINRCAKVVKGGRRFSFSALVVVGDQKGKVGMGLGKAKEVPEAIRKGSEKAHKDMAPVKLRNQTIPHEVLGTLGGGKVLLRPATPGTGVIAGGGVRAVLESVGVKDVLSKMLGSNNPGAVVGATINALKQLRSQEEIREVRSSN